MQGEGARWAATSPLPRAVGRRRGVAWLLAAVLALLATVPAPNAAWASRGGVRVVGGSPEQLAALDRALALFAEAGLELPPLAVHLHDSPSRCGSRRVGHFHSSWLSRRVEVCTDRIETIVHELAHAWASRHVVGLERLGFMATRDVTTWSSHRLPWTRRGSEHAAEILTWGLLGLEPEQVRVHPRRPEDLSDGLRALLAAA